MTETLGIRKNIFEGGQSLNVENYQGFDQDGSAIARCDYHRHLLSPNFPASADDISIPRYSRCQRNEGSNPMRDIPDAKVIEPSGTDQSPSLAGIPGSDEIINNETIDAWYLTKSGTHLNVLYRIPSTNPIPKTSEDTPLAFAQSKSSRDSRSHSNPNPYQILTGIAPNPDQAYKHEEHRCPSYHKSPSLPDLKTYRNNFVPKRNAKRLKTLSNPTLNRYGTWDKLSPNNDNDDNTPSLLGINFFVVQRGGSGQMSVSLRCNICPNTPTFHDIPNLYEHCKIYHLHRSHRPAVKSLEPKEQSSPAGICPTNLANGPSYKISKGPSEKSSSEGANGMSVPKVPVDINKGQQDINYLTDVGMENLILYDCRDMSPNTQKMPCDTSASHSNDIIKTDDISYTNNHTLSSLVSHLVDDTDQTFGDKSFADILNGRLGDRVSNNLEYSMNQLFGSADLSHSPIVPSKINKCSGLEDYLKNKNEQVDSNLGNIFASSCATGFGVLPTEPEPFLDLRTAHLLFDNLNSKFRNGGSIGPGATNLSLDDKCPTTKLFRPLSVPLLQSNHSKLDLNFSIPDPTDSGIGKRNWFKERGKAHTAAEVKGTVGYFASEKRLGFVIPQINQILPMSFSKSFLGMTAPSMAKLISGPEIGENITWATADSILATLKSPRDRAHVSSSAPVCNNRPLLFMPFLPFELAPWLTPTLPMSIDSKLFDATVGGCGSNPALTPIPTEMTLKPPQIVTKSQSFQNDTFMGVVANGTDFTGQSFVTNINMIKEEEGTNMTKDSREMAFPTTEQIHINNDNSDIKPSTLNPKKVSSKRRLGIACDKSDPFKGKSSRKKVKKVFGADSPHLNCVSQAGPVSSSGTGHINCRNLEVSDNECLLPLNLSSNGTKVSIPNDRMLSWIHMAENFNKYRTAGNDENFIADFDGPEDPFDENVRAINNMGNAAEESLAVPTDCTGTGEAEWAELEDIPNIKDASGQNFKIIWSEDKYAFYCLLCRKIFYSGKEIKRHMNFHQDIRPFKCHFCGYWSRTSSQLKVHMKRHQGIKGYACKVCNYNGVTQSDLNRHKKAQSHLCRALNVCQSCGRGFMTKYILDHHSCDSESERKERNTPKSKLELIFQEYGYSALPNNEDAAT